MCEFCENIVTEMKIDESPLMKYMFGRDAALKRTQRKPTELKHI